MKKKLLIVSLLTASTMLIAGDYIRSNDIVTDRSTGIQWLDQPNTQAELNAVNSKTLESGKVRQWIHAAAYCSSLTVDGGGWRLPSYNELDSIIDKNYYNPAIDPIFRNTIPQGYWSSTTHETLTTHAYGVGFAGGNWHYCNKDGQAKFIRCMRSSGNVTPPPPPTPPSSGTNNPPSADAGPDDTVQVNNPVTIDGSGSIDSDGDIVSYRWTRNGSFYSNQMTFEFTPSGTRPKTFELTVTDDEGATDTDEMVLTVTNDSVAPPPPPTSGTNNPPSADAGPDQTVQVNTPATLDGSNSIDSDGDIVAYQWKRKSDGSIWSNEMIFDFTPSGTRPKTFVLTVTDNEGAMNTDEMILSVTSGSVPPTTGNTAPTADAGPDQTVQVNTPATMIGSGSDSDGDIVSYQWTRKRDGSVWSNDKILVFTPSGTRTKTFVLTVTDDEGAKDTDEMVLTVTK